MEIVALSRLLKLKKKNQGNILLIKAIDTLISDLKNGSWTNQKELQRDRPDADHVYNASIYFFDIRIHRTLILIEFSEGSAEILWCGNHQEYELVFKNSKPVIKEWLKSRSII